MSLELVVAAFWVRSSGDAARLQLITGSLINPAYEECLNHNGLAHSRGGRSAGRSVWTSAGIEGLQVLASWCGEGDLNPHAREGNSS